MLKILGLGMLAAGGLLMTMGHVQAAGCNGHVNPAEWGCAPWDNNNGPRYPHYKAPQKHAAPPAAHVQPQVKPQVQTPPQSVFQNHNGGGIMGNSGGNVVGNHGNGVVSQGGGNAISNNGSAVKSGNRNGVVSQGGGNVVSQGGGNVVSQGGGNLVGSGGSSFRQK
jgi:hypothetical protein